MGRRSGDGGLASALTTALRLAVALAFGAVFVPPVAAGVGLVTLFRAPLPGELPDERPSFEAVPSVVLDRNGLEIGQFRGFDRTLDVTQADVPQVLKDAVVAIEDQRFYQHNGVDFEGVARAARTNLELGEIAQGGSTITQQYVKNAYLTGERTFERKFREALLATELEQRMSKDEILFRYLETSYFGSGAYGIGAAAEVYFDKPVSELDISEAATLAGVVQAPTRLSPRVDVVAAESRRQLVLQSMLDQGFVNLEDYEREADRQLWLVDAGPRPVGPVTVVAPLPLKGAADHPFFVDWVEAQLLETLGPDLLYQGGLSIETTIEPRIQEAAEAAAAERLQNTGYPVDMAMVTLDPRTGEVLGMVGGRDYAASQVNLAIGGSTGFQPGSSFKPIVLAEAFTKGIGPETVYPATPCCSTPMVRWRCTSRSMPRRQQYRSGRSAWCPTARRCSRRSRPRACSTRAPAEPAPGPKGALVAGGSVDVQVTGVGGVPTNATAVVLNVTATESAGDGFVTVWPTGTVRPLASSINLTAASQTRPNLVITPVGTDGKVSMFSQRGTHLLADVTGYFTAATGPTTSGRILPLAPTRVFDTRPDEAAPGPKGYVAGGATISAQIAGVAGVPADATAVVLNVTATESAGDGYVTVWPTGQDRPSTSTLNLARAGDTAANLVVMPLGDGGRIDLFVQRGAHLLADVTGYVTSAGASPDTSGLYVPLSPARAFDTRESEPGNGPKGFVAGGSTINTTIARVAGVPAHVGLVSLNVTAIDAATGYVTAFPVRLDPSHRR